MISDEVRFFFSFVCWDSVAGTIGDCLLVELYSGGSVLICLWCSWFFLYVLFVSFAVILRQVGFRMD